MKDGMILFYVKDDEVLPVAMSTEQHEMLQLVVQGVFGGEPIKVVKKSQGKVENLLDKWTAKTDEERHEDLMKEIPGILDRAMEASSEKGI